MKYRYDIDDIDKASKAWHTILSPNAYEMLDNKMRGKDAVEYQYSTIDTCDLRYVDKILSEHPKLRRLMPEIIFESLLLYWQPYDEEW